jgi:hypothetical protein
MAAIAFTALAFLAMPVAAEGDTHDDWSCYLDTNNTYRDSEWLARLQGMKRLASERLAVFRQDVGIYQQGYEAAIASAIAFLDREIERLRWGLRCADDQGFPFPAPAVRG